MLNNVIKNIDDQTEAIKLFILNILIIYVTLKFLENIMDNVDIKSLDILVLF